tara:strand:+ start:85 stop:693 length:609 start_codon:yes stop_codon:yes gene_type:complete
VVLLDEPFSNLDVEVRLRLRSELPSVLNACGASGVLVTHDPEEALAICSRVAVLRDGRLHQCASPKELVESPATPFVGSFVLQRNVLPVWNDSAGDCLRCPLGDLERPDDFQVDSLPEEATVLVAPEAITLHEDADGKDEVVGREFLGHSWMYRVRSGDRQLRLLRPLAEDYQRGQTCRLCLQPGSSVLLHPQRRALLSRAS